MTSSTCTDADVDATWDAFFASRSWRPIVDYDRAAGPVQLLRRGAEWAAGYWGPGYPDFGSDARPADLAPAWRHAMNVIEGLPLGFEPSEFAEMDDDWRVHLAAG